MKSFRQIMLAICVILIASAFAGCGADTDLPDKRPALGKIEYTNLNDSGSRELLQELLWRRCIRRAYSGLFPSCGPL